jgi:cephalosporin hydroxylase
VDPIREFSELVRKNIDGLSRDTQLKRLSLSWLESTLRHKYSYNFAWLGRPVIQYPQDVMAMQELIWAVKPDLIVETGIAHGGSLVFSASLLALLEYCEAAEKGAVLDPRRPARRVLGIDIDIRAHNRAAIEAHPLIGRIEMIEGSSIASDVVARVKEIAGAHHRVLVCLDSNHTHEHVLAELEAYAPLVSRGSYCVVFDTVIEELPDHAFSDRPWGRGDNPRTAVWEYLQRLKADVRPGADGAPLAFEIDRTIEHKLLITVAPDGYLKRV